MRTTGSIATEITTAGDQIGTVHVYDLNRTAARGLAHDITAAYPSITIRVANRAEDVVACTVTDRPYIPFSWLTRGAFVSNVSIMDVHKDVLLNPMGMAVADIACTAEVYTRACRQAIGAWLDLY